MNKKSVKNSLFFTILEWSYKGNKYVYYVALIWTSQKMKKWKKNVSKFFDNFWNAHKRTKKYIYFLPLYEHSKIVKNNEFLTLFLFIFSYFGVEIECKKRKIGKVDFSSRKWKCKKMLQLLVVVFTKKKKLFSLSYGQKWKKLRKLQKSMFFPFPLKARGGLLWNTLVQ